MFKVIQVDTDDNGTVLIPVHGSDKPIEGAIHSSAVVSVLKEQYNLSDDKVAEVLMNARIDNERMQIVTIDGKHCIVRTTKKNIHGTPPGVMEVFDKLVASNSHESDALLGLHQLGIHEKDNHGIAPVLIHDHELFMQLWPCGTGPGGCGGLQDYTRKDVIMWLGQYRRYGMFFWARGLKFEIAPINGDRPAETGGLNLNQQFVLMLLALSYMSQVFIAKKDEDHAPLVSLLPAEEYFRTLLCGYAEEVINVHLDAFMWLQQYLESLIPSVNGHGTFLTNLARLDWVHRFSTRDHRPKMLQELHGSLRPEMDIEKWQDASPQVCLEDMAILKLWPLPEESQTPETTNAS